jgi:DNA modification methylase
MVSNYLYYGDNLDILRRYIQNESVDLIYLDPPFNSSQNYNILFAEKDGSRSAAQIKAFEDTWHWNQPAVRAYQDVMEAGEVVPLLAPMLPPLDYERGFHRNRPFRVFVPVPACFPLSPHLEPSPRPLVS